MLDEWYKCELYDPNVNSQRRFFEILKNPYVRMDYLVKEMLEETEVIECSKVDTDASGNCKNEQGIVLYLIFSVMNILITNKTFSWP